MEASGDVRPTRSLWSVKYLCGKRTAAADPQRSAHQVCALERAVACTLCKFFMTERTLRLKLERHIFHLFDSVGGGPSKFYRMNCNRGGSDGVPAYGLRVRTGSVRCTLVLGYGRWCTELLMMNRVYILCERIGQYD